MEAIATRSKDLWCPTRYEVGDQVLHTDAEIWSPGVLAAASVEGSADGKRTAGGDPGAQYWSDGGGNRYCCIHQCQALVRFYLPKVSSKGSCPVVNDKAVCKYA